MNGHIDSAQRKAEESFDGGLYCAESVVRALVGTAEDADLLTRAATGFCSGMARTGGPCGALSGGIIGIGHVLGRAQSDRPVNAAYAAVQELVGEFERICGARDCHRLLGCDLGSPEGQATFREQQLHRRCREFTARAAELATTAIARHLELQNPSGA